MKLPYLEFSGRFLPIRLAGEEFQGLIGFSRHLGIGFNIIGRLDMFDRFKVCFDESEKVVEFHPKGSKA